MVEPKALEIQNHYIKKVTGKEYKWCDKHKLWCSHSTAECRKMEVQTTESNSKNNLEENVQKSKMVAAFNAIALSEDEE